MRVRMDSLAREVAQQRERERGLQRKFADMV